MREGADQLSGNSARGLLRRLAHDRAGNTLAMIAAAVLPLLAMVGGGIDMGRSYLSQTRLQQACDAGVLAARKQLGSQVVTTGEIPAEVETAGNQFFNVNFQAGSYGTVGRSFAMTLEDGDAISGVASVEVPTTIMTIFGYTEVPVDVACEARLNFSNTDVMFVLDTTGSMEQTNPSDSVPRIDALRDVVKSFHSQLEGSKKPGTRIRYGFVPYSTNVNVGGLLRSDWLVDRWTYQGRSAEAGHPGGWNETQTDVSGSRTDITIYLSSTCPADTATWTNLSYSSNSDGTENGRNRVDGFDYWCEVVDSAGYRVGGTQYNAWVYDYVGTPDDRAWRYQAIELDVSPIKGATPADPPTLWSSVAQPWGNVPADPQPMDGWFRGCIEERSTYEIDDYTNVDLGRALDLDIDLVPNPGNPDTQWRPMLNDFSFDRSLYWDGSGSFTQADAIYHWDYVNSQWGGYSACPSEARKLAEMSAGDLAGYVDSLAARGNTYHDIGMIWGGRLISPTGLFADENADEADKPTSRHLIFLTDGETAPLDLSYASYGVEPLDQRRWNPGSALSLTETVEKRFAVACAEVKKRNVTVWIVGFGTTLNPVMTECAGAGRYFEASDATELNDVFSQIAASMGDLRISK
jgi:Flp pilus assembly protein TadG